MKKYINLFNFLVEKQPKKLPSINEFYMKIKLKFSPRSDCSEGVLCFAEIFSSIRHLIRIVDDQLTSADGDPRILQRIDFLFDQSVVLVDLLEPTVRRSRPTCFKV
jgi:hypothetical protein